jgi:hypothetical protein
MKQMHENLTELEILYWANQERMMAYDQAGNAARDQRLKEFFFGKAEESEHAAKAISEVLPNFTPFSSQKNYVLPGAKLFERVVYQKPATFLISCAKQLETTIGNLYTQFVTELSTLPESVLQLIKMQQEQIKRSQGEMAKL